MYNNLVQLLLETVATEPVRKGLTGGEADNGAYAIRVPDEENSLFVRLQDGDREVQIDAINMNVPIQPDYPVLVYYRNKQAYATPDPELSLNYRGTNEGVSTVAPHSHEPGLGNFDPVSTIRMREGQAYFSEPYSMSVNINAFKYFDLEGVDQWFAGDAIDLTDFIPVTDDMQLYAKVVLDRSIGALAAFPGAEVPVTTTLFEEHLAEIETGSGYTSLVGVKLHTGMTILDDMKYLTDWRFWIDNFNAGGSASGETGVIVEELSDLTDVSSASQTANFILAAGDGTTGGDYRGRALVATDIPGLDAAKIISGTLDAARIPNLDASKIVSGEFDVARIPDLDASIITSGILPQTFGGLGVDASDDEGYVYVAATSASFVKRSITNANPIPTDDSDAGYTIGSQWVNTATGEEFVAVDVTPAAAVWKSTTSTSSGGVGTFHGVKLEGDYTIISGGTPENLPFAGIDYDTDEYFDIGSTEIFTIPADLDGYYQVTLNLLSSDVNAIGNTGTVTYEVQLNGFTTNGGTFTFYYDYTNQVIDLYTSFAVDLFVNIGDEISIRITKNTTDDIGFNGYVMAHLLGASS